MKHIPNNRNIIIGGGGWTPAVLSPAIWIEARRVDKLFQSNAGTSAVTNGGSCGFVGDLSINGFNLTSAANDTTRPTWNEGGGRPYLDFDGSSQVIRRTSALNMYNNTSGVSIFAAMRGDSTVAAGGQVVADGNSGAATQFYAPIRSNGTTATMDDSFIRTDDNGVLLNQAVVAINNMWDNADKVAGFIDITSTLNTVNAYINNAVGATGTYTRSGTITVDRFAVGALIRNTTSGYFKMRLYGLVVVKRVIGEGERIQLTRYLGKLMGLSL